MRVLRVAWLRATTKYLTTHRAALPNFTSLMWDRSEPSLFLIHAGSTLVRAQSRMSHLVAF